MKLFNNLKIGDAWGRGAYFLFIFALTIPNFILSFTEDLPTVWRICNIILPASIYWFILSLNRSIGKMIWLMFPLVFFAAFQFVLLYIFGHSIISVDMFLNLETTNSEEASEVLTNIIPAVIIVGVIYLPFLIWGARSWIKKYKLPESFILSQRKLSICGMSGGLILLIVSAAVIEKPTVIEAIYPLNVINNARLAILRLYQSNNYEKSSHDFTFSASTNRKDIKEIHIMVIGETARACNWSLYGYARNTSPKLANTRGLIAFTDVLTQSNTTHKSVPMLLSAVSADNFDSIYNHKSIITAFKEAGYYTLFISNQRPNNDLIDFFGMEADSCIFMKEINPKYHYYDMDLLTQVREAVNLNSKKIFIVLHTYGSHFNYHERYDRKKALFLPDTPCESTYKNKEYLVNAYDNTILSTDELLGSIINTLDSLSSISSLLYVSDHGEDIFDDNRKQFLHASPRPSYFQLHVPLFVWMSESFREYDEGMYANLCDNRSKPVESSVCVFHTMLSLGGINTPLRKAEYSLTNTDLYNRNRKYLNDHNEGIEIREIIKDKEDIEAFKRHKINFK